MRYRSAGELFGYTPLISAASVPQYPANAVALTRSRIWLLQQEDFAGLIQDYPTIQTPINQIVAQDLSLFSQRIAWEQTRIQELQPYLRAVPQNEPLLGQSKAALKTAQLVKVATSDLKAVVMQAAQPYSQDYSLASIRYSASVSVHG